MMSMPWVWLSLLGTLIAAISGFGVHLLSNFSGRSLEGYCRLKRRRDRFGNILDFQDDATRGAEYLFIFGSSLCLICSTIYLIVPILPHPSGTIGAVPFSSVPSPLIQPVPLRNDIDATSTSTSILLKNLAPLGTTNHNNGIDHVPLQLLAAMVIGSTALLMLLRIWLPQIVVAYGASVLLYHTWPFWRSIALITKPLVALESFFAWIGQRLGDETEDKSSEEESLEDEIRTMVTAGERDGLVSRGMREMIQGVMNLDEGQVSQIMTPRSQVDAIDIAMPWDDMVKAIHRCGRTRLPIYEGSLDNVLGILFVKDLLGFLENRIQEAPTDIRSLLREAWMVPANRSVDELLRDFRRKRNHMAIVVDDFAQTIGVVTIEDALEEIVGEIDDELDTEQLEDKPLREVDGFVEADGRTLVDKINKQLGWNLPESDDYETVGGLLISQLGWIPTEGTKRVIEDVEIVVRSANARQVLSVRMCHRSRIVTPVP